MGAGTAVAKLALAAAAALARCGSTAGLGAGADELPAEAPAGRRRLQLDVGTMLTGSYLHTHYTFRVERGDMVREGQGELWLSFQNGGVQLRLRGAAQSPRFGQGEIVLVTDPVKHVMYAQFTLGELHESQCLAYPFPSSTLAASARRLDGLRARSKQLAQWEAPNEDLLGHIANLTYIQWSPSSTLNLRMSANGSRLEGLEVRRGSRVVKTVELHDGPETVGAYPEGGLFGPPAPDCQFNLTSHPTIAKVEIKPPHRRSSSLYDYLLVQTSQAEEGWPQLFTVLSALTVPGDVAVLIDDPPPPKLGGAAVRFQYSADVVSRGVQHTSNGSIWLDLQSRAFRLRGAAKETKVGPLVMDLIARGGSEGKIYTNVNLTVQDEQQCVVYDYPQLSESITSELKRIGDSGLSYFAFSQINGEDCGIFVAPLARGRWIHIWVDLEGDNPDAILRSEVHFEGRVLRSTDILDWYVGDDVKVSVTPSPAWRCTADPSTGQLAHLGLHEVHKKSIELQDAIYAVHSLDPGFAVLEVLGLTGDIAIMVQEPEPPNLWQLPAVSFVYSLFLLPMGQQATAVASREWTGGTFAADFRKGRVRLSAKDANAELSVALEPGVLAVKVREGQNPPVCLSLALNDFGGAGTPADTPVAAAAAAIFDGVEPLGSMVCNRFTFLQTGTHGETVGFWFSREEEAVCRLSIQPPTDAAGGFGAMINVPEWEANFVPGKSQLPEEAAALAAGLDTWGCRPAAELGAASWLALADTPPEGALSAGVVVAKLADASGVVGLLPPLAAKALSQLVVLPPSSVTTTTPMPKVDMFGPDLKSFSFSFSSVFPLQRLVPGAGLSAPPPPRSRSAGYVYVDLVGRNLCIISKATNMSTGIPQVESVVVFRGDRSRLYAFTGIGDYNQCWSVGTDAAQAPGDALNPFARATQEGSGFTVPGTSTASVAKYVMAGLPAKSVELYMDGMSLVAMHVDDALRNASVGVFVHDWQTAPVGKDVFEPRSDWDCKDVQHLEAVPQPPHWDLVEFFLPGTAPLRRLLDRRR